MGLVQRQGIKFSIVNWVGVMIGVFSTLFIYPHALEEYGLLRFILDTSTLLYPMISLGINSLSIRFFPQFEDKKTVHHGFLPFLLLWGLIGYAFFALLVLIFWPQILDFYTDRNALFRDYLWMILPVSFLALLNNILNQYAVNFKRIVIPSLLLDFSQKIALPLLIIAYWLHWIPLYVMVYGVLVYLSLTTLGFIGYVLYLQAWRWRPDFSFIDRKLFKSMVDYALFGVICGAGYLLVSRLDGWAVSTFVSLKNNGIYSISAFIANVMEVPARAMVGISVPLIAKHWHDGNTAEIEVLYSKVSINLLLIGLLLFGAFWVSAEPFFKIIANGDILISGKMVILLLGIAKLVDMATGLNNYVLSYSRYFKYCYLQIGLPAVLSVGLSLWLVPLWGIVGAATAMLCSTVFYNLMSLGLNWHFFRIQPFSAATWKALALAVLAYGLVWLLPAPGNPWLAIFVKSGLFVLFFTFGALWGGLSSDMNALLGKLLKSVRKA